PISTSQINGDENPRLLATCCCELSATRRRNSRNRPSVVVHFAIGYFPNAASGSVSMPARIFGSAQSGDTARCSIAAILPSSSPLVPPLLLPRQPHASQRQEICRF